MVSSRCSCREQLLNFSNVWVTPRWSEGPRIVGKCRDHQALGESGFLVMSHFLKQNRVLLFIIGLGSLFIFFFFVDMWNHIEVRINQYSKTLQHQLCQCVGSFSGIPAFLFQYTNTAKWNIIFFFQISHHLFSHKGNLLREQAKTKSRKLGPRRGRFLKGSCQPLSVEKRYS